MRKVLVVDDEKLIVKGIKFSLEQDEMQVDCAYDGEEALEKAKEEIKRYGLELKQNPDIEILKAPNYDEISYVIKSGRLEVNINALTGKLTGFYQNSDNKEKQLEKYHSTKEKIVEVAKEKMKEYGFGSEYEICYISNNNSDDEEKAYLWYIWFAKKYDGLFNEGQSVSITLIPQINFVESLNIKDEQFENNPIVISEKNHRRMQNPSANWWVDRL